MHVAQLGEDDTDILPQYITDAIDANGGWEGDTDDPDNSIVTLFNFVQLGSLEGSGALHPYADQVGITNQLITVPGGGHGNNFDQIYWDSIAVDSGKFLETIVCGSGGGVNINEPEDVSDYISIAPNPATDQTIIRFNNLNKMYDLSLYNAFGQQITFYNNQNENDFMLNRNQLPAGVYFVQIDFEDAMLAPVNRRIVFR